MPNITVREPGLKDEELFLEAMLRSCIFHHPWIKAPLTQEAFKNYLSRYQQTNHKSFLAFNAQEKLVGVFNINEIVRGVLQSAYLGFYANLDYSGSGSMSAALKCVLKKVFEEMGLHRLEANIQPENHRSIYLVRNNGFRKEGFSPRYLKIEEQWRDHERWAITSEDFRSDILLKTAETPSASLQAAPISKRLSRSVSQAH